MRTATIAAILTALMTISAAADERSVQLKQAPGLDKV